MLCLDQDVTDFGAGVIVADENRGVDLEWTVGGAFQVDSTQVMVMVMVTVLLMVLTMLIVMVVVVVVWR